MSDLFTSVKNSLKSLDLERLFDFLEQSDVSDLIVTTDQPLKAKLIDGSFIIDESDECPTPELIEKLSRKMIFNEKNRAIFKKTLHRVSAIRYSRIDAVTGFTFRVARPNVANIELIEDILKYPKTTLFVGKPGSGKTTYLRAIAQILSNVKHTVVVDKSNEIAGDSPSPHKCVGNATVMQLPVGKRQGEIITEAVENHNPDIVIVDEISDFQQAEAIREACQKGIVVFATMHGDSLKAIVRNPIALKLLGSFSHAAVGDKLMRSEGLNQKTVVEQIFPSAFERIVILKGFDDLEVIENVDEAIKNTLRGETYFGEWRQSDEDGYKVLGSEKVLEQSYKQPKAKKTG